MNIDIKKRILSYMESHNDNSEEALTLISKMRYETDYADCDTHSVCVDDLAGLSEDTGRLLREKLRKNEGEEFDIDDCQSVADAIAELISDEYVENIHNAIRYAM